MTAPAGPLRHERIYRVAPRINRFVLRHGLAGGRRSPIGVLGHVGRTSGATYATPVLVHQRGGTFIMPLTYGPASAWCRNVIAAGACSLQVHGGQVVLVEPRLVGRASLGRPWQLLYAITGHVDFLALSGPS